MKIAILTLPLRANYGGIIQNYALQTVLEKMGHQVETINLRPKAKLSLKRMPFTYAERILNKILGKKDSIIFLEQKRNKDKIIIEQEVRKFIRKYIHLTPPFISKKDFRKYNFDQYDAIVVGSDQVWRIPYAYPGIETYFLDFINNDKIKKIALSASFGTDEMEFTEPLIKKCGNLIKEFEIITVREQSAIQLINNYKWQCKTPPVHTLDPTMLLSKEDYIKISTGYTQKNNQGGLFYYILDMTDEKMRLIQKISSDLGLKPFTVSPKSNNWLDKVEERIAPPVEEWLQAFNQASFVFTDSFHGTVFSIIFNKEFITIGNKERGMARFHSLLNEFKLQNRFITSIDEYKEQTKNTINWNSVNAILEKDKRTFFNILKQIK